MKFGIALLKRDAIMKRVCPTETKRLNVHGTRLNQRAIFVGTFIPTVYRTTVKANEKSGGRMQGENPAGQLTVIHGQSFPQS